MTSMGASESAEGRRGPHRDIGLVSAQDRLLGAGRDDHYAAADHRLLNALDALELLENDCLVYLNFLTEVRYSGVERRNLGVQRLIWFGLASYKDPGSYNHRRAASSGFQEFTHDTPTLVGAVLRIGIRPG